MRAMTLQVLGWILLMIGVATGLLPALRRGGSLAEPEGAWAPTLDPGTWPAWVVIGVSVAAMMIGASCIVAGRRARRGTPGTFLTADESRRLITAIRDAEQVTSGEIRVHVAHDAGTDVLDAARGAFERLGMTATAARNGVLFFVDVGRRRIAVLGDAGIDAVVPDDFWDHIIRDVREGFAAGHFADALIGGVEEAGRALATHFPRRPDDVNELPDDISRDE